MPRPSEREPWGSRGGVCERQVRAPQGAGTPQLPCRQEATPACSEGDPAGAFSQEVTSDPPSLLSLQENRIWKFYELVDQGGQAWG